jgi:sulfoxide reductase catalytic subunit YedY
LSAADYGGEKWVPRDHNIRVDINVLIKTDSPIPSSQITPQSTYCRRRELIKAAGLGSLGLMAPGAVLAAYEPDALAYQAVNPESSNGFHTSEKLTPFEDATRYNNFYEFGTDKSDPAKYGQDFKVSPWTLKIEGEVEKPLTLGFEDVLSRMQLEERVYRLRCVEAWSMVLPWVGFSLADWIKSFKPTSRAKYVEFTTLYAPEQMRGQRSRSSTIDWPYREGLRIDEAMNPLSFMAVGLYGKEVLPQNGAPLRLVVPWKYGFKSIKSIVKIRFTERQPATTWENIAPSEYGFYANVNPQVSHPRWSQAHERRLPSSLFKVNRIPTEMFNGYGEQVAHLYDGMNLRKYY